MQDKNISSLGAFVLGVAVVCAYVFVAVFWLTVLVTATVLSAVGYGWYLLTGILVWALCKAISSPSSHGDNGSNSQGLPSSG